MQTRELPSKILDNQTGTNEELEAKASPKQKPDLLSTVYLTGIDASYDDPSVTGTLTLSAGEVEIWTCFVHGSLNLSFPSAVTVDPTQEIVATLSAGGADVDGALALRGYLSYQG